MANKKEEPSMVQQGEVAAPSSPPAPSGTQPVPPDHQRSRSGNAVFKSGPLFLSSKGIGWTSWKKRWFILTGTSLVFFRSDPSAAPQKGGEVNLTLGGIDLNNSGSVVVKADKKLLTVLFPDGREGRAFTLKAETSEDLYGWKTALEDALAQAPNAANVAGKNGILRNDQVDATEGSKEQSNEKPPTKYAVAGTPILLALEDAEGAPTFLEKTLRFVEQYGVKVEGILRQAASVDDVERRMREYEQGKTEFSSGEDAHVIADCVKYVLRELPSSPVPASCCKALLEACRADRAKRVNAMRGAICETFPEPNRRLLERILKMMQVVASNKNENRMSSSAVAACMAPLLLRPLLHGDCEIENDFDVGGDGSMQLMQAAAAANHAQAIVITLLEEYKTIFGGGSETPDIYSDEESGSETDDDDESYIDDEDYENESGEYTDDDLDNASNMTGSENDESDGDDLDDEKDSGNCSSGSGDPAENKPKASQNLPSNLIKTSPPEDDRHSRSENITKKSNSLPAKQTNELAHDQQKKTTESAGQSKVAAAETDSKERPASQNPSSVIHKSATIANGPSHERKRANAWGRTSATKNPSMESIDFSVEEEDEIERLETSKADLQHKIGEEVKGNAHLQAKLEKQKGSMHECRLALEKDVARLQEQLQKEKDKRRALEAGLDTSKRPLCIPPNIDEKTKTELEEVARAEADINNLKQKVEDLSQQLNQREQNSSSTHDSGNQSQQVSNHQTKLKVKPKETEDAGFSLFGRSRSKEKQEKGGKLDTSTDGGEGRSENEKKQSASPNKNSSQSQQSDSASVRSSNSGSDTVSAVDTPPKASKKSATKGEGANAASALTKLSNRLNFLKERRGQIANDIQKDKGQGSNQGRQEKNKGSEPNQSAQNPEKSRGSDAGQSSQNPDKGAAESQAIHNSDKSRKADSQNQNGGRSSEDQHPAVHDRGRSEAQHNTDKQPPGAGAGRNEGQASSRTFSR